MNYRKSLPAGLLDVGFASLATFGVGIVAARFLSLTALGAYAVYFRVFLLASVVSEQLVFRASRIEALVNPQDQRVQVLRYSLLRGAPIAVLAAVGTAGSSLMVTSDVDRSVVLALSITTPLAAFLSPLQDQVRRVFHLSEQSWKAVAVSTAQMLTVFTSAVVMLWLGLHPAWIPFGSLSIANAISLLTGLAIAGLNKTALVGNYRLPHLMKSGRWFLLSAALPTATAVGVTVVIAQLAGSAALGHAEAARVAAQPVLMFSLGLAAVINPRAMEAARQRSPSRARALSRSFDTAVVVGTLVMFVFAGFDFPWNLLADLLPNAYVVGGVTAVSIVASGVNALVKPEQAQLASVGQERRIVVAEVKANVVRLLTAATAASTQAFALPLAVGMGGVARFLSLKIDVSRIYGPPESAT